MAEGIALHSNDDIVEEEKGRLRRMIMKMRMWTRRMRKMMRQMKNKKRARKSVELSRVSRVLETMEHRPSVFHVGGWTWTTNLGGSF